jgi:NAD+ kinase
MKSNIDNRRINIMKKFVIIPNITKDTKLETTGLIIDWLEKNNCDIFLTEDVATHINKQQYACDEDDVYAKVDGAIVLGGDGTILNTARKVVKYDLPILGVNLGYLGFLAEVERKDALTTLEKIIKGNYYIQSRMMLNVKRQVENVILDTGISLNDIVVSRTSISRMMKYNIAVNDRHVNNYSADGIIVSTPTGSTAYNLSAGGPILDPKNEMMVITPICPHSLTSRSIVLSQNDIVTISFDENMKYCNEDILLTIDGQVSFNIDKEQKIIISKSDKSAKLITCNQNGFYNILKKKLGNR